MFLFANISIKFTTSSMLLLGMTRSASSWVMLVPPMAITCDSRLSASRMWPPDCLAIDSRIDFSMVIFSVSVMYLSFVAMSFVPIFLKLNL